MKWRRRLVPQLGASRWTWRALRQSKALTSIREADNLVITAIEQAANSEHDFHIGQAIRSVTVKLVGYIEVARVLHPRVAAGASVVLFGGLAKDRAYLGSTMVHNSSPERRSSQAERSGDRAGCEALRVAQRQLLCEARPHHKCVTGFP